MVTGRSKFGRTAVESQSNCIEVESRRNIDVDTVFSLNRAGGGHGRRNGRLITKPTK